MVSRMEEWCVVKDESSSRSELTRRGSNLLHVVQLSVTNCEPTGGTIQKATEDCPVST